MGLQEKVSVVHYASLETAYFSNCELSEDEQPGVIKESKEIKISKILSKGIINF